MVEIVSFRSTVYLGDNWVSLANPVVDGSKTQKPYDLSYTSQQTYPIYKLFSTLKLDFFSFIFN